MPNFLEYILSLKFHEANAWLYLLADGIVFMYILVLFCSDMVPLQNISDLPKKYRHLLLRTEVIRVPDGDGFEFVHIPKFRFMGIIFRFTKKRIRARLAGIDAPEIGGTISGGQALAEESCSYLCSLIFNKQIIIQPLGVDRYYRLLVIAWVDGINVNQEMVKAGYAVVYRERNAEYGSYYHRLDLAEKFAKKRSNGVWALREFETPAEYKRRNTRRGCP